MEELNKEMQNENLEEVNEEVSKEAAEEVNEDVVSEAANEDAGNYEDSCCCGCGYEIPKKKISVMGIILYVFGAVSIVFGIINLIITLNMIKTMYGSLEPLDFYTTLNIVSPLVSAAVLGVASIGIGRVLSVLKNK